MSIQKFTEKAQEIIGILKNIDSIEEGMNMRMRGFISAFEMVVTYAGISANGEELKKEIEAFRELFLSRAVQAKRDDQKKYFEGQIYGAKALLTLHEEIF